MANALDAVIDATGADLDSSDWDISDAELTALALGADPDVPLAPDAVPVVVDRSGTAGALPAWYMPPATMRSSRGWRTWVILGIIGSLLLIDVLGLCITYGQLVAA